MLTITREARDVIRQIPRQAGHLPSAGLRIAAAADAGRLHVSTSLQPRSGDQVVDCDGARVFLDPLALGRLQARVLEVDTRPDGRLEFRSVPQEQVAPEARVHGMAA